MSQGGGRPGSRGQWHRGRGSFSSLAVQLAHLHAEAFAGGVPYVNMRSADGSPRSTPDVAARLLRDLGIAAEAIPHEADASLAALRSVLAREAVLLVLDNAANAEQVQGLIPANRDSVVIVTSRAPVAELGAARLLELRELEEEDGVAVLKAILGRSVQREAAAAVVKGCAGLPLAIAVAGTRVRRGKPLEDLATDATQGGDPLAALDDPAGIFPGDSRIRDQRSERAGAAPCCCYWPCWRSPTSIRRQPPPWPASGVSKRRGFSKSWRESDC